MDHQATRPPLLAEEEGLAARSNRQNLVGVHRYDHLDKQLLNFCCILVRDLFAAGQPAYVDNTLLPSA
jgi:hypothetical protein